MCWVCMCWVFLSCQNGWGEIEKYNKADLRLQTGRNHWVLWLRHLLQKYLLLHALLLFPLHLLMMQLLLLH